jgi:hypothetical protein
LQHFYCGYDIFDKAADEVFGTSNPKAVLPREIKNKQIAEATDFDPRTHVLYFDNNVGIYSKLALLLRFRPIPDDEEMHKTAERIAKSMPKYKTLKKTEQEKVVKNEFKKVVHARAERIRDNLLDMKSIFDYISADSDLISSFTVPDKTDRRTDCTE